VRGLLVCEMYQTTRGILENFLSLIDRIGFIPNGGRIYYTARSQPPLLSGMIKSYVEHTHDVSFAIASIDLLVREFDYFMTNKTVIVMKNGKGHRLARYIDHSNGPRPESYREDVENGKDFPTEEERQSFYADCKAGGESGMDFSSRWFINENGENIGSIQNLKTRSVVAVELNSILYWNAMIISEFYGYAGNVEKQKEFETKAEEILVVRKDA
jgi:alpha,alpha-trehalase